MRTVIVVQARMASFRFMPIHKQSWYRNLGFRRGDFPQAVAYYNGTNSLPIDLSYEDQGLASRCLRILLA